MKRFREFATKALISGILLALPAYLAILLILRAMKSLGGFVRPITAVLPSIFRTPAIESALALFLLLLACFAIGAAIHTRLGRPLRNVFERSVLTKVPGYSMVQGLARQLTGQGETVWQPALVEMAAGLQAGFIIEQLPHGRYTVFIPTAPAPVRGAVYVLPKERVHPVDASFAQTFQALTRWGSGLGTIVASLDEERRAESATRDPGQRTKAA